MDTNHWLKPGSWLGAPLYQTGCWARLQLPLHSGSCGKRKQTVSYSSSLRRSGLDQCLLEILLNSTQEPRAFQRCPSLTRLLKKNTKSTWGLSGASSSTFPTPAAFRAYSQASHLLKSHQCGVTEWFGSEENMNTCFQTPAMGYHVMHCQNYDVIS